MATAGSATEKAYRETRQGILEGRFPGNSVLSEGQISMMVGISRTPVREAFLRLQTEGLLTLYPKRGAVVTPVNMEEVGPILEARELLVGFALEKILTTSDGASPELLTGLHDALIEIAQASKTHSLPGLMAANRDFYARLFAAADNPFVAEASVRLLERQDRLATSLPAPTADHLESAYRKLGDLARAIEGGDLDQCLAVLRAHMRALRTFLTGQG